MLNDSQLLYPKGKLQKIYYNVIFNHIVIHRFHIFENVSNIIIVLLFKSKLNCSKFNFLVVIYVYVNNNNTKMIKRHTLKDYGKLISNVSISIIQNCISVKKQHYKLNTGKVDQLSSLATLLGHAVKRIFFTHDDVKQYFLENSRTFSILV